MNTTKIVVDHHGGFSTTIFVVGTDTIFVVDKPVLVSGTIFVGFTDM